MMRSNTSPPSRAETGTKLPSPDVTTRDVFLLLLGFVSGFLLLRSGTSAQTTVVPVIPSMADMTTPSDIHEQVPNHVDTIYKPHEGNPYARQIMGNCSLTNHTTGTTFIMEVHDGRYRYLAWKPGSITESVKAAYFHSAPYWIMKYPIPIDVLDIGGNEGQVGFQILVSGKGHRVLSVEPVSKNLEILCKTGVLNRWLGHRFLLVHAAMSDHVGEGKIYIPDGYENNAAVNANASTANVGGTKKAEKVVFLDGDGLLETTGLKPKFIKIDTQGHELSVLKGLKRYLERAKSGEVIVMAEYATNLMRLEGVEPIDIYMFMNSLGYEGHCNGGYEFDDHGFVKARAAALPALNFTRAEINCLDIFWTKP